MKALDYTKIKYKVGHFILQLVFNIFFEELKIKNTNYIMTINEWLPWPVIEKLDKQELLQITNKVTKVVNEITGKEVFYETGKAKDIRNYINNK